MRVHRSALVARPATQMFDLIEAAEDYPRFLPWCTGVRILQRDETLVAAELQCRWRGAHFVLRTRNPKRRPEQMLIHLDSGPFRRFEGQWLLKPLAAQACKVEFDLDYAFDNAWISTLAGPFFDKAADTMVDAFVARALSLPLQAG